MTNAADSSHAKPKHTYRVTDTARTRAATRKLDDKSVRTVELPTQGNRIAYDALLPGFGCASPLQAVDRLYTITGSMGASAGSPLAITLPGPF